MCTVKCLKKMVSRFLFTTLTLTLCSAIYVQFISPTYQTLGFGNETIALKAVARGRFPDSDVVASGEFCIYEAIHGKISWNQGGYPNYRFPSHYYHCEHISSSDFDMIIDLTIRGYNAGTYRYIAAVLNGNALDKDTLVMAEDTVLFDIIDDHLNKFAGVSSSSVAALQQTLPLKVVFFVTNNTLDLFKSYIMQFAKWVHLLSSANVKLTILTDSHPTEFQQRVSKHHAMYRIEPQLSYSYLTNPSTNLNELHLHLIEFLSQQDIIIAGSSSLRDIQIDTLLAYVHYIRYIYPTSIYSQKLPDDKSSIRVVLLSSVPPPLPAPPSTPSTSPSSRPLSQGDISEWASEIDVIIVSSIHASFHPSITIYNKPIRILPLFLLHSHDNEIATSRNSFNISFEDTFSTTKDKLLPVPIPSWPRHENGRLFTIGCVISLDVINPLSNVVDLSVDNFCVSLIEAWIEEEKEACNRARGGCGDRGMTTYQYYFILVSNGDHVTASLEEGKTYGRGGIEVTTAYVDLTKILEVGYDSKPFRSCDVIVNPNTMSDIDFSLFNIFTMLNHGVVLAFDISANTGYLHPVSSSILISTLETSEFTRELRNIVGNFSDAQVNVAYKDTVNRYGSLYVVQDMVDMLYNL